MGGEKQKTGIIKPHEIRGQAETTKSQFLLFSSGLQTRGKCVNILALKISQVVEFRVHKLNFSLAPTTHYHAVQSTTVCKSSKYNCEHFPPFSIQLCSQLMFYGNCRDILWNSILTWQEKGEYFSFFIYSQFVCSGSIPPRAAPASSHSPLAWLSLGPDHASFLQHFYYF